MASSVMSHGTTLSPAHRSLCKPSIGYKQRPAVEQMTKGIAADSQTKEADHIQAQDSLEAVKILLHTSLATMCYLRNLCTDDCFQDRFFGHVPGQPIDCSYSMFLSGHYPRNIGDRHTDTKILVRGTSDARADRLLDWLELGVFDALSRSVLASMRVTIFVDKPSNVVEAYTYTFKYFGTVGGFSRELAGMELSGQAGQSLAVRDVQRGVQAIIRRLILYDQVLPALPDHRFLNIQLFYTEDCPPSYEPLGFEKCEHWTIFFPNDERTKRDVSTLGQLDTGFHRVGLEVTSLQCVEVDSDDSAERGELPSELCFPSNPEIKTNALVGDLLETQITTQDKVGAARRKALQPMVLPGAFTQNTNLSETQQPNDTPQTGTESESCSLALIQPSLSHVKLSELHQRREQLLDSGRIAGQNVRRKRKTTTQGEDIVRCQCNWNKDEGDMICCDYCETWQHVHCYGYTGSDDKRIPSIYACYHCLLGDSEGHLLAQMKLLCLTRRALVILNKDGYPCNTKDFAKSLHCDAKTATVVTDCLLDEGFITTTPGSHFKGFTQKGLPKYQIITTPEMISKRAEEYFNPLVNIAHHYNPPPQSPILDYSLNLETLSAPPNASTVMQNPSILPAKPSAEAADSATEDDELIPVLSQTSSTRNTSKQNGLGATLSATKNDAASKGDVEQPENHSSSKTTVTSAKRKASPGVVTRRSPRKRVKTSQVKEALDVALDI